MSGITRIISASFIIALAGCGEGTGPYGGGNNQNPPPPPANTVNATASLAFSPASLTISPGETVTFAFGSVAHNVFFDAPDAATPTDIPGNNSNKSVQRTFSTAGTYRYHCTIHPTMTGTVTVR